MSQVNAEHITVECKCGKRLKAPASAVGKKAKCPKCGAVMRIEAPPPPPEELGEGEIGLDALYEVAAKEEKVAASQEGQSAAMRCPSCGSGVDAGAVICVNCGYDFRTNRKVAPKAETVEASKKFGWFGGGAKKDKPVDKMAPQGSFFVGVAVCAAFALIGAIIWVAIAYFTKREFAIVAMGVGALAGLGMQIGQKGFSRLGGAIAAGMTLLAIIVANVAYFVLVVAVAVASADVDEDFEAEAAKYDERVVEMLTDQNLKAAGVDTDEDEDDDKELTEADLEAYEKKHDAARRAAVQKLKTMPKAEYDKLVAKQDEQDVRDELVGRLTSVVLKERSVPDFASDYDLHYKSAQEEAEKRVDAMAPADRKKELQRLSDQAEKELREEIAKARADRAARGDADDEDGGSSAAQAGFFLVLLLLIFGWKSILFVVLGMFFAYRTAAGSVHG